MLATMLTPEAFSLQRGAAATSNLAMLLSDQLTVLHEIY